jgi:hypothetical protein
VSPTAARVLEFQAGTGRYKRPKRGYAEPEEIARLKKQHHDALTNMRRSRDAWRLRAECAEAKLHVEPKRIRWSQTVQLRRELDEARQQLGALERVGEAVEALQRLAPIAEDKGIAFAARKIEEALRG